MACLDQEVLVEFVARSLSPEQAARVETHLADCAECRQLVFALADHPADGDEVLTRIGRFEVAGTIGQGTMGIVYRARDPELDRIVAVKVRRGTARLDADSEERLRREARALARLSHSNVVTVYETGTHEGNAFVAMEFVDGVPLDGWLREPRSLDAKLDLMMGAGRGLAAAHAVGLIHRDFKPHNVFVSAAGTAKVGDFGLVRVDRSVDNVGVEIPVELAQTLSSGSLIGTPAYMSPEQLRGEIATEASDQFSFCVTLYEALFGKRPFTGETIRELIASIERGVAFSPLPRIPARVRGALQRGLAFDPARRFPSMTALIDVLGKNRPRLRWLVAGAAVLAVGGAFVIATAGGVEPCSGAGAHARAVWNGERIGAIERAFASTKLPYADHTARRVRTALDDYTARWAVAHRSACEAGQRKEHSADVLDARMQCLGDRLDEVRALTAAFSTADATVVRRAVNAVAALAPVDRCLALDVIAARVRPPDDAATRTAVDQLRRELAEARVDLNTGRFAKAGAATTLLVERARRLGYQPALAEALLEHGYAQVELDDAPAATAALDEAARVAYATSHDDVAARAWLELGFVTGSQAVDAKAAGRAAEMAKAAMARVPRPNPTWRFRLISHEALALHAQGEYRAALVKHREALALGTTTLPPDNDHLATARHNLANTLNGLGQKEEAIQILREALAIRERGIGPQHPDTATTRGSLASILDSLGRHEEALAEFDRVIAVLEGSVGDHPLLATALTNSCHTLQMLGRTGEGLVRARRALAIFEKRPGPTHPVTGTAMAQLAGMLAASDGVAEAIELYRKALAIQEGSLGKDHPTLATTINNLGFALLDAGKPDAAIEQFQRALAIVETKLGPEHRRVVYSLIGLGKGHLAKGEPARAIEVLRRTLGVQEKVGTVPGERGEARFDLARALWQTGDRKQAKLLARQAFADFEKQPTERAAVEQWLAKPR